jgi:hypothetical protein
MSHVLGTAQTTEFELYLWFQVERFVQEEWKDKYDVLRSDRE